MRLTYRSAWILLIAISGCSQQSTAPAPQAPSLPSPNVVSQVPAPTSPTPGKEVEEVKKMLADLQNLKSMSQMADFFTNESAAAFGVMMMIPLSMAAAFEDMGANMAKQMEQQFPGGKSSKAAVKSTEPSGPKIKADLDAIMKKYGVSEKTAPGDEKALAALNSRGREFLRDIGGLLDKLDQNKKPGEKKGLAIDKGKMPINLDEDTFKVISPMRVEIKSKDPKEQKAEARWEDGRWRLHIGDLKTLMEQNQMKMGSPGATTPKPKP